MPTLPFILGAGVGSLRTVWGQTHKNTRTAIALASIPVIIVPLSVLGASAMVAYTSYDPIASYNLGDMSKKKCLQGIGPKNSSVTGGERVGSCVMWPGARLGQSIAEINKR